MNDDIPEEDQMLKRCEHDWMDMYHASGMDKKTPKIEIVRFFCKKCLTIRKKTIDISDQLLMPDTKELYGDYE